MLRLPLSLRACVGVGAVRGEQGRDGSESEKWDSGNSSSWVLSHAAESSYMETRWQSHINCGGGIKHINK